MIARSVNAAADVIHRAQVNGAVTATGLAVALESAQMLVSPEMAHEAAGVEAERDALKARVAELETERHSTNEALSDTAEQLRVNRDRIAELETGITWRDAERDRWADVRSLVERAIDKGWSSVDTCDLEDALGPEPAVPPVEADGVTRLFAPSQALRVEAEKPGACDACGDMPERWCPGCGACKAGCHGGHDGNPCSHANAPWGGA